MIISELMLFFSSYSDFPEDLDNVEVVPFLYLVYKKRCKKNKVEIPDYYDFIEWYQIWFLLNTNTIQ
jgi:hypothetical protein